MFEWLFSTVLSGGLGSIPGQDMSVLGPLVQDEDDLGQVSLFIVMTPTLMYSMIM
jgi:hypothetical protein